MNVVQGCNQQFSDNPFSFEHLFWGFFSSINLSLSKRKVCFQKSQRFHFIFFKLSRQNPSTSPPSPSLFFTSFNNIRVTTISFYLHMRIFFLTFLEPSPFYQLIIRGEKKPFFKQFLENGNNFSWLIFFFHQAWEFFIIKTEQTRKALSTFRLVFFC